MSKNINEENSTNRSKLALSLKLFSYLKPYKVKAILVIFLILIAMIANIINPYLFKIAIDDKVQNKDVNGLIIISIILIVANFLALIVSRLRWKIVAEITNNILINIRLDLYKHIQKLSFSFFDNRPVGKILARVMGDVNSLQNLFKQAIQTLIPDFLNLVLVSIMMLILNYKLALATICVLPIIIGSMFYIETFSRKKWMKYRSHRSTVNGFTHEDFSGIKIVQSFAKENDTSNTFKEMLSELMSRFISAVKLNDTFWPVVELCWGTLLIVVYIFGYSLVTSNEIQIGTLLAFTIYMNMFWRPIINLTNFYNTLVTNFAAADRIFDILDIEPDLVNKKDAIDIGEITGNIQFDDVTFSYDGTTNVLENVSFKVNSGERIALVGPTGAGKTTITSLISRFYDTTSGTVLIDGHDIKDIDLEAMRSQMGIMLQDTFLFSTSIKENIRYGKLDATDEEVILAAKAVSAHDFIMKMEKGYDTEVNERGSRLSLGQRQLISFARALLANPKILILDEATSNIDTQTEKLVEAGIEKLLENRTSFVIAHRLSTIRDCDKIMVISDSNVSECGTHEELLKQKGLYYDLYTAQFAFLNDNP